MDRVRTILISPEVAIVLAAPAVAFWWPRPVLTVGHFILAADTAATLTMLAGVGTVVVATYKLAGKLLHPNGRRPVLVEWPQYWRLRLRAKVAVANTGFGFLACLLGWVLLRLTDPLLGATLVLAGVGVALCSLATVANATWDLRDILDGAGESPPHSG